jgi:hypothetical protein
MKMNGLEEKYETTVYVMNGITFVPSYDEAGMFVGPGHNKYTPSNMLYTSDQLEMLGAKKSTEFLWKRPIHR